VFLSQISHFLVNDTKRPLNYFTLSSFSVGDGHHVAHPGGPEMVLKEGTAGIPSGANPFHLNRGANDPFLWGLV